MKKRFNSIFLDHNVLWFSFFIPMGISLVYFISRQMFPFGNNTILTVDLGQQYVDFYSFFKDTLLHHPERFFFSFSKAIGGQMIGEWAYYLLSPFNLILLFFSQQNITAGILLITILKYGFSGLSFAYFLEKRKITDGLITISFATSYAFMAWNVANQLNLIWTDAPILLPFIILGFFNLMEKKNYWLYPLTLALMFLDNYYMGYMVAIFLCLFFIWYQTSSFSSIQTLLKNIRNFIIHSFLAASSVAVLLIPTFYTLINSKGQYTEQNIHLKIEYNPLKILSKFTIGSFDFEQMPTGYPNLFIGSLGLILFFLYFFNPNKQIKEKISASLVSILLFGSLFFEPLDLLWHGMQFPVWYPYRFSFIVSFWMLFLAANAIQDYSVSIPKLQASFVSLLLIGIIIYSWINQNKFSYISKETLILTSVFFVLALVILNMHSGSERLILKKILFLSFVIIELSTNFIYSLNNLSYLSQDEFANPSAALSKNSQWISHKDSSFYRIGQIYSRTKNDGLAHNMNSGSYFSSALEKNIPDFYGMIGQPDGDNYVTYSNGTLITDSLLAMKYFIAPRNYAELDSATSQGYPLMQLSQRQDLSSYKYLHEDRRTKIFKNQFSLPLGYASNASINKIHNLFDNPIVYQTNWLNSVSNSMPQTRYFTAINFNHVIFSNTKQQTTLTNATFKKSNPNKVAKIIFKFTPKTNDSYYLSLGSNLDKDNVEWYLNDEKMNNYDTFRHTTLVNVANHAKNHEITITAKFKNDDLWLENFVLYQMDNKLVKSKIKKIAEQSWQPKYLSDTHLTGPIHISKSHQWFTTTIPYNSGWKAYIDDKEVTPKKVQNTFLAFPINKGKHQITLKYTPPYFFLGLWISIISIGILGIINIKETHKYNQLKKMFQN